MRSRLRLGTFADAVGDPTQWGVVKVDYERGRREEGTWKKRRRRITTTTFSIPLWVSRVDKLDFARRRSAVAHM